MTTIDATTRNIRRARTLGDIPPDQYLVPFANIATLLDTRAQTTPETVFLRYYNDNTGEQATYTYAEFNMRTSQVAHLLLALGVRRGDRVATLAHNHHEIVCVYAACWKLGATVVPQNVEEDDTRIAFALHDAGVLLLLALPEYVARARTLPGSTWREVRDWRAVPAPRGSAPILVSLDTDYTAAVVRQSGDFSSPDPPTLEDEALLVYTSGTTGVPKGVQLSQYNLLVDAWAIADWHALTHDQCMMCVLPIHHVNGIVVTLLTTIYAGARLVLNRGFRAHVFWRRIAEERVQVVSVVPTLLQYLCEQNEDIGQYDLSAFRHLICGAGTLSVVLVQRFESRFGKRIIHGYGLSETTAYACLLPVDLDPAQYNHWMYDFGYPSIGCPLATNTMAIHDAEGRELPDGTRGEIVIRGHNVMIGYFRRPDANADSFKHGWFRSGDEGFVRHDATGRPFFFITGRIKELINRGGVKYSPLEIEEVLMQIPGVRVGLAIAFDNTWYGEEVGAYIVRESGATITADDILAYCRSRMPFAKCPKVVVFGEDIPVTSTGKYQRLRLKEQFRAWTAVQFRETVR